MKVPFLDLRRQHLQHGQALRDAMDRVLQSGRFILGNEVLLFEEAFARYCGVSHAVGVASGTEAIYVALAAAGVGSGHEVVTVPNVSVPTACGIRMTGATPVFVDVDANSRNLRADLLESAITRNTRAIVPVHLYGMPADMAAITKVATSHGIPVIEDAAQAHGARLDGRRVGSWGTAACFSFYPTKNLGALGDGGAVLTNDPSLAERARMIREYGQRERYYSVSDGVNSRLDEIQAAALNVKLAHLDEWNRRRCEIADRYRSGLADGSAQLPTEVPGAEPVYHLFVIEVPDRERFRKACAAAGVETAVHYPTPVHLQPAYRRLKYQLGDFPVSERLCESVVSLPLYPELREDEIEVVIACARGAM